LLEEGAAFCSNCGTEAPPATLTFDALPEWWKKAAIGLVGLTVVGVLVSSLWPSGDSAVPEPASAAAEPETSASNDPSPPRSRPPMARPPVRKSTSRKTVSSPMGDWNVRTELSPLDDIKTVYLDLKAADSREVRGTSAYAPQMGLMCTGSKIEGYVFIRSRPEVDRSGLATVRIRFDTLEPQTRRLEKSLKEDALFLDKPASTLKDMLGHERMLFGYTPLGSEEVVTEFNLRGVEEAVKPFVEGCDIPELAEDEQAPEEVQTETP
jgi:type VI secretion system protein VasI